MAVREVVGARGQVRVALLHGVEPALNRRVGALATHVEALVVGERRGGALEKRRVCTVDHADVRSQEERPLHIGRATTFASAEITRLNRLPHFSSRLCKNCLGSPRISRQIEVSIVVVTCWLRM